MENPKNEYDNKVIKFKESSFRAEKQYTVTNHPTLFYPEPDNIKGWIAEAITRRDYCVQFFGKHHTWEVVDRIVMDAYEGDGRQIHINYLHGAVEKLANVWDQISYLSLIGDESRSGNKRYYEERGVKFVKCESDDETLIAVGVLNEDYTDGDPDPYQTAGGYRSWRALKGTRVEYHLNTDLTIRLRFDSNCEVDHYNNNYCGVSTGGGTTKYKVGERVEKRSVTLGREAFDTSWKKADIDATMKKLDYDKMVTLIDKYQPELSTARKAKRGELKCEHKNTYTAVRHESGESLVKCKDCSSII